MVTLLAKENAEKHNNNNNNTVCNTLSCKNALLPKHQNVNKENPSLIKVLPRGNIKSLKLMPAGSNQTSCYYKVVGVCRI